jgi:hypothetical protein
VYDSKTFQNSPDLFEAVQGYGKTHFVKVTLACLSVLHLVKRDTKISSTNYQECPSIKALPTIWATREVCFPQHITIAATGNEVMEKEDNPRQNKAKKPGYRIVKSGK